jgi:hypothetical protein
MSISSSTVMFKNSVATSSVELSVEYRLSATINVRDFGAKFDGVTDDTSSILNAMIAVKNRGGGTVLFPAGVAMVTSIAFNWNSSVTVNLRGEGKIATILRKIPITTNTPVLDFANTTTILDINSVFSDFSVEGHPQLLGTKPAPTPALPVIVRITNCARFSMDRIKISLGVIGIENRGSLIFSTNDLDLRNLEVGYRQSRFPNSTTPIYCNLIEFNGGVSAFNTVVGFDLNHGSHVTFRNVDMEVNGTLGNLTTGCVRIRSEMCVENPLSPTSIVRFDGGWMERNNGIPLMVESAPGLQLSLRDWRCESTTSGQAALISAGVTILALDNIFCKNVITSAASISRVTSCNIDPGALVDSAAQKIYIASQINGAVVPFSITVSPYTMTMDVNANLTIPRGLTVKAGTAIEGNLAVAGSVSGGDGVLISSTVPLLDNTGTGTGTLTNCPRNGNPSKWVRIQDAGVYRFIPAWDNI